jgi:hypothetical protein
VAEVAAAPAAVAEVAVAVAVVSQEAAVRAVAVVRPWWAARLGAVDVPAVAAAQFAAVVAAAVW